MCVCVVVVAVDFKMLARKLFKHLTYSGVTGSLFLGA